jgi:hypothetical protein
MKTAVEKLFELIDEIPFYSPEASDLYQDIMNLKDQAKEMEKDQIERAYLYGCAYGIDTDKELTPGSYYKEVYKSE